MKEIWKSVIDNPKYQISSLGRVRGPKKILKPHLSSSGYWLVCIGASSRKHGNETRYVHRLMAEAFIPNDNPLRNIVNHKDRNRQNNTLDNLEWVTHFQNMDHWSDPKFFELTQLFFNKLDKLPRERQVQILQQVICRIE